MEPLNYLFVFYASLLGYVLGMGLARIAPEELESGHRYLSLLERSLFALSFLPMIYFFGKTFIVLLPISLLILSWFLKFKSRVYLSVGIFMIWFFIIQLNDLVVVLEASTIFLYGLPAGSLLLSPSGVSQLNKKVKVR